jgi:hypothetical protein
MHSSSPCLGGMWSDVFRQDCRSRYNTHTHTHTTASCATSAVQEGVPSNGREWNVGAGPNTPQHSATSYFTAGKIEDTRNSSQLLPIRHRVATLVLRMSKQPEVFLSPFRQCSDNTPGSSLSSPLRSCQSSPHCLTATAATRAFHQLLSLLCAFA